MKKFFEEYGVFDFVIHVINIIVSGFLTVNYLILSYNDVMFTLWLFIFVFWIILFTHNIKTTINTLRNGRQ